MVNDPTRATIVANAALHTSLPFDDTDDFVRAERGLQAPPPDAVTAAEGRVVWESRKFDFVVGDAPESVNPSLWRQERLNGLSGLFEVVDGIYQVRNLDLSNISFVRGETG